MQPIQRSDQYCRAHRTALAGMCADELSGLVSFGMIVKGPESPVKNSRTGGSGRILALPPADREPSRFAAARRGEYAGMFRTTLAGPRAADGDRPRSWGSIE